MISQKIMKMTYKTDRKNYLKHYLRIEINPKIIPLSSSNQVIKRGASKKTRPALLRSKFDYLGVEFSGGDTAKANVSNAYPFFKF